MSDAAPEAPRPESAVTTVEALARDHPETIGERLRELALINPNRTLLTTPELTLSYGDMEQRAAFTAAGLAKLGVSKGDAVCQLLPNCADMVINWMALAKLGAIHAPLNYQFTGDALARLINLTAARVLVLDEGFQSAIAGIIDKLQYLETIIVRAVDDTFERLDSLKSFECVALTEVASCEQAPPAVHVHFSDPAMLMFTSGTTGPSKAVELSHRYALTFAALYIEHWQLVEEDVFYTPYPLYHVDASLATYLCALHCNARAVIVPRFSASRYWDEIREHQATITTFMGAVATFLFNREPRQDDADNPLRVVLMAPIPSFWPEFEKRFGVRVVTAFGGTEFSMVFWQSPEHAYIDGTQGKPCRYYEVRIGDELDNEQPEGVAGEILVRSKRPCTLMSGYYRDPGATLETWRNLWHHTGDLGFMDEDGHLHFIGRMKDSIRRRGENISAYEVEEVLDRHEDVVEVAVVGVPSEYTEEEVKAVLEIKRGSTLTPKQLLEWADGRLPRYAVPRFIEFVDALPHTETDKVQKAPLRESWRSVQTYDAEVGDYLVSDDC